MVAFRIAYTLSLAMLGNLASGGMCGYFRYLLKCQRIFIIHLGFRCPTHFDGVSRPGDRDSEIPPTEAPNDLELDR